MIEFSFHHGIDFSTFPGDIRLGDVAETVKAQQVHWGTFQEIAGDRGDPTCRSRNSAASSFPSARCTSSDRRSRSPTVLRRLHEAGGRNGGIILSKSFNAPGMLRDFVELVVPELQRRGLTKKRYAGTTLRENLN